MSGSGCLQWLPVSGWVGWGRLECGAVRVTGMPGCAQRASGVLGFSVEPVVPADGRGVKGCHTWPWESWQGFSGGYYGPPPQPSTHWVLSPDLTPEMGET